MIKAVIIEDEPHVREIISRKIEAYFHNEINLVGFAARVTSGLELIHALSPRLVFLDIELLDGTGFEILEACDDKNFKTIVITAFNNFAIKALKSDANDYILKPIDEKEFILGVTKAIKSIKVEDNREHAAKFTELPKLKNETDPIIFKTNETIYSVREKDILYCKSDVNYTRIYLENGNTILVSKTMKLIENTLNHTTFIRCHKSFIVNKQHVFKYDKNGYLLLKQNIKVPVSSRRKKETLFQIFKH